MWDYYYEAACRIVQAFDPEFPSPNVLEVIQALSFVAVKQNTISTKEIVHWAKDYCAEWYDKHMKDGEHKRLTSSGEWKRMSDLPIETDDRFECSICGNVVHYHDRINLYTFNDYCGRCGSYNGFKVKDGE